MDQGHYAARAPPLWITSATINSTKKESVRAKMRIEVRKMLARYGYPPDLQKLRWTSLSNRPRRLQHGLGVSPAR